MNCPVCKREMKVNEDFQIAKCDNCDFWINWSSPMQRAYTLYRLCLEIGVRKHGWKRR